MVDDGCICHLPRRQLAHAKGFNHFRSQDIAVLCRTLSTSTRHPRGFSVPEIIMKLRPGLIRKVLCSQSRKILFDSPRPHRAVPSVETREVTRNAWPGRLGIFRAADGTHRPTFRQAGMSVQYLWANEVLGGGRKDLIKVVRGIRATPWGLCTWRTHVNMLTCSHFHHGASWHSTGLHGAV